MENEQLEEKKIASIDNQYTKEQIKKFNKEQRRIIFRRRRLVVIFGVALVCFLAMGINLFGSYQKITKLRKEKAEVVLQQEQVDNQLEVLEQEVALLKDDRYLEKLARAKYYYSKEGELIYSIPQQNIHSDEKEIEGNKSKKNKESQPSE